MVSARVKVSPKFEIVIPKELRDELKIEPGQELVLFPLHGSIRVEHPRTIKELRGIAKGIRWRDDDRDHTDRF
jgi:AbrB family looped-hinge helix DNA binding protein